MASRRRRPVLLPRPCPTAVPGAFGPGWFSILIWAPVLAIDPVVDSFGREPVWAALAAVGAVLAANAGAVLSVYREGRAAARRAQLLLGAQAALTFAAAAYFGDHWFALFTLLALAVGAVAPPRWAPPLILAVTFGGAVVAWVKVGDWTQTWTTALTSFLAGFGTFVFQWLLTVIAELNATREELARKAVDRERERFSRDLHDLLGHTLSVIVVKAEVIRRVLPGDPGAAAVHASDVEEIGRRALGEVREAVTGYRDADVSRELDRARVALDAAGIELRVAQDGEVPRDVDVLFGWVVREAVTNVVRHSGAHLCTITLTSGASSAVLTVADDGYGGEPSPGGGGIRGLRERAEALGGELTAAGTRRGFTLRVEAPTTEVAE
ncbi:MAG TPA: histidine kinase [Phytomonospora sp.]